MSVSDPRDSANRNPIFEPTELLRFALGIFGSQSDRDPDTDVRFGPVSNLCHLALAVVCVIKNHPILAYLLLRCLPLAGCIAVIGFSLSFLDWNSSSAPVIYVCIVTGIVLAHALLFSDQDADMREFFWISLFFITSAPLLQFAPIQMDHYSLYRVGDFYGTHLPYMFALLINLVLAASGGLMFHVLSKRLSSTNAARVHAAQASDVDGDCRRWE